MGDASSSADAQIDLKKRARRRLVGAIALALTAAIVLPMVMDHEPRPPAQEIQIRIPAQEGAPFVGRLTEPPSVSEPVNPTGKSEMPPPVQAPTAPQVAPSSVRKVPESNAAVRAPVSIQDSSKELAKGASSAKAEDKPAVVAEKPAAERSSGHDEEERVAALLSGKGTEGEWVIQLGAYRDPAKARNLIAKLKEMGVPTYTEKIDSPHGPMTRVRAGPFPSREAAEKAYKRVKIVGVDGPIAQR